MTEEQMAIIKDKLDRYVSELHRHKTNYDSYVDKIDKDCAKDVIDSLRSEIIGIIETVEILGYDVEIKDGNVTMTKMEEDDNT